MKQLLCVCVCLLLTVCSCAALADSTPLICRVSDAEGHSIYLLGTIHMGKADMYPIAGIDDVMDRCDTLALEVYSDGDYPEDDEDGPGLFNILGELSSMVQLERNTIGDETLERVASVLGLDGAEFLLRHVRPYKLASIVVTTLLENAGISIDYAVENYLVKEGRKHGLKMIGLETNDFQNGLLAEISDANTEWELNDVLDDPGSYCEGTLSLLDAWARGDREAFAEDDDDYPDDEALRKEMEDFDKKLTVDRNIAFAQQAEAFLKEGRRVLIAIGASHVSDPGGLTDLLSEKGYLVEQISPAAPASVPDAA